MLDRPPSSGPQHLVDTGEIGQSEEHGQLAVVLLHPPVARLCGTELAFEDLKDMFHLGPDAGRGSALDDHRRVREVPRDVGQYSVSVCLPMDVIGVYVLLPDAL